MPIRELPARPNLEHLKNQPRTLLRQAIASDASAAERFAAFVHVIAREYGFDTGPALKLHVDNASEEPSEALIAAIKAGNAPLVRDVLLRHPSLKVRIDEPLPNYGFDAS